MKKKEDNMVRVAEVGKKQTGSDCFIRLEIKKSGGLDIRIKSKVESMYGESIRDLATEMLGFFDIKHAKMSIEDGGSVPFILRARMEFAVKKCFPGEKKEFVVAIAKENQYEIERDNFRRSRLYVPGDQARLIINAGLYRPDGIILDLEDAVAPAQKEGARFIVRNALREMDFYGAERMVRINQLSMGLKDLEFVVGHGVHTILIPKVETADQVKEVDKKVQKLRKERKIKQDVYLMPIIESALGAINAYQIATASPNTVALTIGLEDYSADICDREGEEDKHCS
jgi:citrate lyase subunit beta/citryl-CoA lyase